MGKATGVTVATGEEGDPRTGGRVEETGGARTGLRGLLHVDGHAVCCGRDPEGLCRPTERRDPPPPNTCSRRLPFFPLTLSSTLSTRGKQSVNGKQQRAERKEYSKD